MELISFIFNDKGEKTVLMVDLKKSKKTLS